jgi:cytoskeletal protein RodZ
MKILQKNKPSKPFVISLITLAILLLLGAVYVYGFNGSIFNWRKNANPSESNSSVNNDRSNLDQDKNSNDANQDETNFNTNKSSKNTPENTNSESDNSANVIINSLSQDSSGTLNVRSTISTIQQDGICTITITKNNNVIVKETAGPFPQTSYSACGFNIEKTKLQSGLSTIRVEYTSKAFSGSATRDLEIQ